MTTHLPWHHPRRCVSAALVWALMAQMVVPAHAFVSQLPGAYTAPPDTNVMFTLDDSGSMESDMIPDWLDSSGLPSNDRELAMWSKDSPFLNIAYYTNSNATNRNIAGRYLRSSDGNPIYYNPKVRYRPWPDPSDDKPDPVLEALNPTAAKQKGYLENAKPKAVRIHPTLSTQALNTIDLTVPMGSPAFWPATYFIKTSKESLPLGRPVTPESTAATFEKVEIRDDVRTYQKRFVAPELDLRTDCAAAASCTYEEELQNFANWLQYYRSRSLMAKGGVSAAFARQATNLRVGYGSINKPVQLGVRAFEGNARRDFYDQVYDNVTNGNTPLRTASIAVGEHFRSTGRGNPWAENPGTDNVGTEYACRRSFHILSTDGYWNEDYRGNVGNADNFSGATPTRPDGTSVQYGDDPKRAFSVNPFADGSSDTLSDAAAFYWKEDLRPDLRNIVIPSSRDPAFWQHLTTYTIGFGIGGTGKVTKQSGGVADLSTQESRDKLIVDRTPLNWPTNLQNLAPETGDDLIHASMSGRGRYMNATNPTELANNLASALAEAVDNPGDLATLAVDSAQVLSGGRLYQAIFSPARWYGRLYAFNQNSATGVVDNRAIDEFTENPDQVWEASNKMPAPDQRNIFTSQGGTGTGAPFTWDNLSTGQRADLDNDRNVLDYLRGDGSREIANGGGFRDRSRYTVNGVRGGVLGDIVGGSPLKGPDAGGGYDRLPTTSTSGQASYATFRSATGPLTDMLNTIFLGANDGMLHAFNLTDGVERFAYVPSTVYNVPRSTAGGLAERKLRLLASPEYTHRFTVDGPPNVADAYLGGEWRSVLVGSTGAGARGIFAMDVTRPAVASGGFDATKVMWEFSEADSDDMGFVLAYPHVVRMRNDKWAVITGNGYDSKNGRAVLFIRDAETGASIKEFVVGPTGGNGLSQPNFILNAQREVVAIYAGDLKGNLWKFDVNGTDPATWVSAFGTSPLFQAIGPGGKEQPITVMPEISSHPNGGAILIFGTGKLFEPDDTKNDAAVNVNLATQSLYGIWDKPLETAGLTISTASRTTVLMPHTVKAAQTGDSARFRRSTAEVPNWGSQRGWVIDLASGGERSNLPAQQFRKVIFMATNTPAVADPCANSGTSKIFALDPVTGAAPAFPVFDTNANGLFDPADNGLNVLLNDSALLTQPVFQVFATGSVSQAVPTVQPIAALDRGQATSARSGGVELSRASGSKTNPSAAGGSGEPDCKALLSAAKSNTDLLQQLVNGCASKARVSWRQLK